MNSAPDQIVNHGDHVVLGTSPGETIEAVTVAPLGDVYELREPTDGQTVQIQRRSHTGQLAWERRFSASRLRGNHLAVDPAGNLYGLLELTGPADFGSGRLLGCDDDVVLLSLDPTGQHRFSRIAHAAGCESMNGVGLVVRRDDVVIAVDGPTRVDLGGGVIESNRTTLAAYSFAGEHLWSRGFALSSNTLDGIDIRNVAGFADGSLAVSCWASGSFELGGQTSVPFAPFADPCLMKLAADGSPLWFRRFSASSLVFNCVAALPDGGVGLLGDYHGSLELGGGVLSGDSGEELVWARYAADGSTIATRALGVHGNAHAFGFAAAPDGTTIGLVTLAGTLPAGTSALETQDYQAAIVRFSPDGQIQGGQLVDAPASAFMVGALPSGAPPIIAAAR